MGTKKSQTIGFRVSESLKETLGMIAAKETRTVSLQVEHFIKQGIREYLENNPAFESEKNSNSDK